MNILAQRSKFLAGCLTAIGFILLTAGILIAVFISPYAVTLAVIGGACFLIGLYLLLSPTIAVAEKDGDLFFCFFLRRIRVSPAQIEFVHYLENGTMATRGGGIAGNWHILKNDIRTLTVTIREGTTSRRLILLSVLHTSAAALELETLRDRAKAKESAATEKRNVEL